MSHSALLGDSTLPESPVLGRFGPGDKPRMPFDILRPAALHDTERGDGQWSIVT